MRPGEVCSLRPCDIDRTGDVWRYIPPDHKMKHKDRQRIVYIGPKAQKLLAKYLLRPANQFCFSPMLSVQQKRERLAAKRKTPAGYGNYAGSRPAKRKPVREPGEKYTANSFRVAVMRACEAAFNMPKELRKGTDKAAAAAWRRVHTWHPNQLRHTFATQARVVGGIESVQALLGHAELSTAQIYAEKSATLASDIARRIG
jgi:site-specific recombinase XerD